MNEDFGNAGPSRKRRRSEEEEHDDSDSDFYGFAADSTLFDEEQDSSWNLLSTPAEVASALIDVDARGATNLANDIEVNAEGVRTSDQVINKRTSKRKSKKKRKIDFVYY